MAALISAAGLHEVSLPEGERLLVPSTSWEALCAAMLAAVGVHSVLRTPVDALPDLSDVQVIVRTPFPGQAPADMGLAAVMTLQARLATTIAPAEMAQAGKRLKAVDAELQTLEERWLELTDQIETATA